MQQWIIARVNECPPIMAIGYFGSYARGDAGVGSDLDVVMIVTESNRPFEQRAIDWDFRSIPVPVELLVYTLVEWQQLPDHQHRFHQTLTQETIWLKRLSG